MTLLSVLVGAVIGSAATYFLTDYRTEKERRDKVRGLLTHVMLNLSTIKSFIDSNILLPLDFDSSHILVSRDVLNTITDILGQAGHSLLTALSRINTAIKHTNYIVERKDSIATSSTTDAGKDIIEIRQSLLPHISECQKQIEKLLSDLNEPMTLCSYTRSQIRRIS
jgi:gas vesicle protein